MASQPTSSDPYSTASAQNAQNSYASQFSNTSSNANEVNPYGSVSYNQTGQTPIYTNGVITGYSPQTTKTTTLSPDQQKLLGLETQSKYNLGSAAVDQSANVQSALSKPVDQSSWTPWQTTLDKQDLRQDTGATDRASIEKAMMDSYNRSVAPTESAQEASLAARGLSPGSGGYSQYQATRDDSRAEQARQAYLASGTESRAAQSAYNDVATSRFDMDQSRNNYLNNLRGSQASEAYTARSQPINEVNALLSGSQATIPQFQSYTGSSVTPSNISQYISDNYKTQSQAASNTNAGLFGLAGGATKLGVGLL
jgi:hypothetical protein